eukprot:CFRG5791T1
MSEEKTLQVPSKEHSKVAQSRNDAGESIKISQSESDTLKSDSDAELFHEAKLRPQRESVTFGVVNNTKNEELQAMQKDSLRARISLFFASVAQPKDIFEAPRECHIPVPSRQIVDTILAEAKKLQKDEKLKKEDRKKLSSLLKSMTVYFNMRYNITRETLLKDYSYFDPDTSDKMIKLNGLKGEALMAKEDMVLDRLNIILNKANFKMLTADDVEKARSANYKLKSDVYVDEDEYDTKMLSRFFERHGKEFMHRADQTDFFLVYYRGIGVAQQTDIFVTEKLELILDRIKYRAKEFIFSIIYRGERPEVVASKLAKISLDKEATSFEERKAKGVKISIGFVVLVGVVHEILSRYNFGWLHFFMALLFDVIGTTLIVVKYFIPTEAEKLAQSPRAHLLEERQKFRREHPIAPPKEDEIMNKIERLRLDQLSLVPGDLLLPNTIQEPTFAEVIVVHRPKHTKNILISEYHDIPMADVELIFPIKKLVLNSTDLVITVVSVIMGMSALLSGLSYDDGSGFDDDVLYTLAIGVFGLAIRSYFAHANAMYYYESLMTDTLFNSVGAVNRSSILSSVFKCQEQEISEAILALWMLIKHGKLSEEDVDMCAEAYMQLKFQVNMDFEIDDAMDKLNTLELVEKKMSGLYKAKSPSHLVDVMAERWSELELGFGKRDSGRLMKSAKKMNPLKLF